MGKRLWAKGYRQKAIGKRLSVIIGNKEYRFKFRGLDSSIECEDCFRVQSSRLEFRPLFSYFLNRYLNRYFLKAVYESRV